VHEQLNLPRVKAMLRVLKEADARARGASGTVSVYGGVWRFIPRLVCLHATAHILRGKIPLQATTIS